MNWVKDLGEKIEFPKNYEYYLNQGKSLMECGETREAVDLIEKAYTIKSDRETNLVLVTVLYQVGEYEKAKNMAGEHLSLYQNDEQLYALYTSILIKNHDFLQAEKIIAIEKNKQNNQVSVTLWQSLAQSMEDEKESLERTKKNKQQQVLKNVFSMSNQSLEEQSKTFKETEILPPHLFLQAAESILTNPFVNGITKTTLLQTLLSREIDTPFTLEWFNEKHIIIPKNLVPFQESKAVQAIEDILKEQLENNNPVLYQIVSQEIYIHFMLLYPFIDEIITVPEEWVQLYIDRYEEGQQNSYQENGSEQTSKLAEWMLRLDNTIEELTQRPNS